MNDPFKNWQSLIPIEHRQFLSKLRDAEIALKRQLTFKVIKGKCPDSTTGSAAAL